MATPDTTPADVRDPAILRMERRLRLLEELTDIGMDLARALRHDALATIAEAEAAAPADPAPTVDAFGDKLPPRPVAPTSSAPTPARRDPAAAFASLSRAIRLTLTLEARTDEALRAHCAGVVSDQVERAKAQRAVEANAWSDEANAEYARRKVHVETITRLVCEVAEREVDDAEALYAVLQAMEQRLEEDGAYEDLESHPVREIVERLCADLQLTPDWTRWTGDGWVPKEPFYRPKASPFRHPSREPYCAPAS